MNEKGDSKSTPAYFVYHNLQVMIVQEVSIDEDHSYPVLKSIYFTVVLKTIRLGTKCLYDIISCLFF